ncbi:MAG TPA: hypothetical protein VGC95_00455 [Chitinophagaceae bacterium]
MKHRRFIQKLLAVLLLALFTHKAAIELFIHVRFHSAATRQPGSTHSAQLATYNCNCVSHFSMPFATPIAQPACAIILQHRCMYVHPAAALFTVASHFAALRGPPASSTAIA